MREIEQIRHAQAGDPDAREALARAWMRRVYAVALAVTGRPADAEEATQDAFLRAFRSLRRLRAPERFGPWLTQIARNAARDFVRGAVRRRRIDGELAYEPVHSSDAEDDDPAIRAWRALPDDQRLVCWLHVMHDMPFRDIAHLLDQSASSVFRVYRKGMALLRQRVLPCTTRPTN